MPYLATLVLTLSFFWLPDTAGAQLLACSGAEDCNFCTAIITIQRIINFVVLLAVILATIMLAITGFKMVASKGNPGAMQAAKDLLVNICIGILLILAAWTLVDTLLKILVRDDANIGLINFGPQYRIDPASCGGMNATGDANTEFEDISDDWQSEVSFERDALGITVQGSSVTMSGVNANPGGGGGSGGAISLSGGGTAPVSSCNTANLRTINFMSGSITIHQNMVASAQRVDQRWRAQGSNRYRVTSIGSYSCRNIAGSGSRSAHSYGLAIDINAGANPHCPNSGDARCGGQNILVTDMPASFVNIFIAEGWGWGGNWRSSKDAMHFSKTTGEGGNMRGD